MYLVDFSNDYYGNKTETTTFNSDVSLIDFVADKSQNENFKVHRINEYRNGVLLPHELELKFGCIVLVKQALEAK